MVKKVRKVIEKLSDREEVVEINDSSSEEEDDSSSEEEMYEYDAPPPPSAPSKPAKLPAAKVECDKCGGMFSKGGIRLHKIACEKKHAAAAQPKATKKKAMPMEEDDKPMTMKQYKAMMAATAQPKKVRKPYTRKPKVEAATPPSRHAAPAQMYFV